MGISGEQWKIDNGCDRNTTNTGEDIYLLKNFNPWSIFMQRTSFILIWSVPEDFWKQAIGDYAEEHASDGMHQAGTPRFIMANVHCAAATQNF